MNRLAGRILEEFIMAKVGKRIVASLLILSLFLFAVPVIADVESDVLMISQAKNMALTSHPEIKKQLEAIELARINKNNAETSYEIAKANYTNNITRLREAVDAGKQAFNAAKYAYEDANTTLNNLKLKIEYDLENLYLSMLNFDNTIKIMEDNCAIQQKAVNIEQIKLTLGMSTQSQLNQQVQKLKDLKNQLQGLYDTRETQRYQMNRFIGRNADTALELAPVTFEPIYYTTEQAGEEKAKEASLAIKQYNRTINDKIIEIDNKKETATDKVEKLEVEINQLEYLKSDVEYNIKIAVKNAHEKAYLAQESLVMNKSSFETAEVDYKNQQVQYELGLISKIALDASKLSYMQKKNGNEKAVYDYYLAQRAVTLTEKGIFVN